MRFLENRISVKKTGPKRPGGPKDTNDRGDHDKTSFLVYVNVEIKQTYKTGRFTAKPDPGQFLSGKKFAPKIFLYIVDFKNEVFGKPDFGQKIRIRMSGKHQQHVGS